MESAAAKRRAQASRDGDHATFPLWTVLLPIAASLLVIIIAAQRPDGRLHLWVLDVGQGDAILLRTPRGHTALVDGGPAATPLLNGVGRHLPAWQRRLDLIVLTHPQQDHLMGLVDLLARYDVDQVVQTEFTATLGLRGEWLRAVGRESVPVHHAKRGEQITFAGEPEVSLRVLHPSISRSNRDNPNDSAIVLKLTYGKQSVLLAGDAEMEAEAELARLDGPALRSHVLKVGHHGSDTSSTAEFVSLVGPKVAIISVGSDNRFGHPSLRTLQTLEAAGAKVYRTDLHGTIEIIADRERLWVRSER